MAQTGRETAQLEINELLDKLDRAGVVRTWLKHEVETKLSVEQKQELEHDMLRLQVMDTSVQKQRCLLGVKWAHYEFSYRQGTLMNFVSLLDGGKLPFQMLGDIWQQIAELRKDAQEFEDLLHEMQEKREQLRKTGLQAQETVHDDMRNMQSALLALQQEVARMQDSSSCGDSSSVVTVDSWIHVGSSKPCCFLPDTHFQVFMDDGQRIFAPASMLYQGAKVQSATGKVIEVVHPPEQHQVDSVIELKAGSGSLVVSPDHRVLVPGNSTVKAQELRVGDEVILDGTPARLTSCEEKPGKTLVIRLGFKPDLPVAVSIRFA